MAEPLHAIVATLRVLSSEFCVPATVDSLRENATTDALRCTIDARGKFLLMYRLAVALCALLFVLADPSSAAAIGVAVADGSSRIDSHPVIGDTTLFDGNRPETNPATPELRLYGGAPTRLASNSRGTVFSLMRPGTALAFVPQQGAGVQVPFEMSGCLERRQNRFVLRDLVSGVLEEVRGSRLELEVGNTVQVTARVLPGVTPVEGATEVMEFSRLRRISGGCAAAAPEVVEEPRQGKPYRWNAHGFFTAGGSLAKFGGRFKGGGGGVEAFIGRGLAAGAEVSVYRDTYYGTITMRTLDHVGANVSYHFTARERARRMDPFVLFGVGRYFPGQSRVVVHGGGGFTYWFKQRVGARFEFRVGEWQYAEYTVGAFRLGIAFR
jgi:hypothetical protein